MKWALACFKTIVESTFRLILKNRAFHHIRLISSSTLSIRILKVSFLRQVYFSLNKESYVDLFWITNTTHSYLECSTTVTNTEGAFYICNKCWYICHKSAQYVNKIRYSNDNLIEIIQNLQTCYLKFHAMNDDFEAILKLSNNSNTLILDKVWHTAIATNCHFKFY